MLWSVLQDGSTPLHLAARSGQERIEVLRQLVGAGAHVEASSNVRSHASCLTGWGRRRSWKHGTAGKKGDCYRRDVYLAAGALEIQQQLSACGP
jgi:ankyrin repeat protein